MSRSLWKLLITAAAGLHLVPLSIASASEPAVDRINFRWSSGYSFERQEDQLAGFPFFFVALPELETHTIGTAGTLVLPLAHSVGARIRLGALGHHVNSDSPFSFFGTESFWMWQIDTAADLFLRDSDIGHIDIGYRFAHQEAHEDVRPTNESHSFAASAGLFTDGFGTVPVDLETSFLYSRVDTDDFSSGDFDQFTLAAFLQVHAHRRLRVDLGTRWQLSELQNLLGDQHDIRGVAEFMWLPPLSGSGDSNYVTFSVFGTGGQVIREFPLFEDVEQDVFSVGFGLTVLFTPVESLIQYTRHRS